MIRKGGIIDQGNAMNRITAPEMTRSHVGDHRVDSD